MIPSPWSTDSPLSAGLHIEVAPVIYPPGTYDFWWPLTPVQAMVMYPFGRWHGCIRRDGVPVDWVIIDNCKDSGEAMHQLGMYARRHYRD